MATGTQEEFVERTRGVVSRIQPGEWITGGLWGAYDQWAIGSAGGEAREPFAPDMTLVNEIAQENPMLINKFDSTEYAANKAAFAAAGLDWDNPQGAGVEFVRGADGVFRGMMRGRGVNGLFGRGGRGGRGGGAVTRERWIARTKHALSLVAEAGVTNVNDVMSGQDQVSIWEELRDRGELTVRVYYRHGLEEWQRLAAEGIKVGSGDAWLRFGSLKGHIDGIMGTEGARFFQPYDSDPNKQNRGYWRPLMHEDGVLKPERFRDLMVDADKAGLQMTVHAIGDEANNVLMNFMDHLLQQNGAGNRRFRIVHAQVIAPDDFKRMGPLGMIAEVQPFHLSDDMRWMEERIGHERCKGAYAFKSIADAGAILSFGTDWPGTSAAEYPINPMLGLYAAVTRETVNGTPEGGWFPEEKIDIKTAIKAYTFNTAFANFEEEIKGSIEVGKLADITVMDRNLLEIPPDELLEAKALYTIVDGRIVFERR
jgi:hypothetical protein